MNREKQIKKAVTERLNDVFRNGYTMDDDWGFNEDCPISDYLNIDIEPEDFEDDLDGSIYEQEYEKEEMALTIPANRMIKEAKKEYRRKMAEARKAAIASVAGMPYNDDNEVIDLLK